MIIFKVLILIYKPNQLSALFLRCNQMMYRLLYSCFLYF